MKHKLFASICIVLLLSLGALGYGYSIVQAQLSLDPCKEYENISTGEKVFETFFSDAASFVGWTYTRKVCDGAAAGEVIDASTSSVLPFDLRVTNQSNTNFFMPYRTLPELHSFLRAVDSAQGTSSALADLSICITAEENTESQIVDTGIGDNGLPYLVSLIGCDAPANACGELTSFTDPRDGTNYSLQATDAACWMAEDYNYWWVLLQDLWDLDMDNDNTIFYDIDGGSYVDGAIIPTQLYNICQAFLPEGESDGAALASFYYEEGSSEVMSCEYTNGENYVIDNIPELQDGTDYNGIIIGDNLYDYHSNDDDFLNNLCPTGWHLPTEIELLTAFNDLTLTNDGVFLDPANKIKYHTGASAYFAWGASYNGYTGNYAIFESSPTGKAIAGHTRCVKD